ncbi:hypothetical protein ACF06X_26865 [Streptomyces sp. NPDC015346]|uniref:hypothetical protein n=1 Tax=Streptomyces sp. NPDC015346 TaxID=3364954 RepID=UPI0036F68112
MPSHARKNAARQHKELSGLNRRAALQAIRDTLPPAPRARSATTAPSGGPAPEIVPAELIALVQSLTRSGSEHLDEAVRRARRNAGAPSEWNRLVLYSLTDALAYNVLLVGALAAYLQEQGIDPELLRSHLQSPDPDRYVTQQALDLVAGLLGRTVTEGRVEPTWHFVGRHIAERGLAPDRN